MSVRARHLRKLLHTVAGFGCGRRAVTYCSSAFDFHLSSVKWRHCHLPIKLRLIRCRNRWETEASHPDCHVGCCPQPTSLLHYPGLLSCGKTQGLWSLKMFITVKTHCHSRYFKSFPSCQTHSSHQSCHFLQQLPSPLSRGSLGMLPWLPG